MANIELKPVGYHTPTPQIIEWGSRRECPKPGPKALITVGARRLLQAEPTFR